MCHFVPALAILVLLSIPVGAQTPAAAGENAPAASPPAGSTPPPPAVKRTPAAQAAFDAFQKKDYPTAFAAAKKGAAEDDAESIFFLARLTGEGWGTKADPKAAFALYEKAAAKGNLEAAYHVARCTEEGLGTKADPAKADFLSQQSAEAGFAGSQNRMGRLELYGTRRPRNEVAAREWFEKAAAQSDPDSLYRLGMCYLNGWGGLAKDKTKAVDRIIMAANGGSLDAINQVGLCYQYGIGTALDKVAAAGWFRFAAEYDFPAALSNLGQCYEVGQGVKTDMTMALNYYKLAAAKDDSAGHLHMGRCLAGGLGLTPDPVMASVHFTMAFELGLPEARKLMEDTKGKLTPAQASRMEQILQSSRKVSDRSPSGPN